MTIFFNDGFSYTLQENERLTEGVHGVYVWDKPKDSNGFEQEPYRSFYSYGCIKNIERDAT